MHVFLEVKEEGDKKEEMLPSPPSQLPKFTVRW